MQANHPHACYQWQLQKQLKADCGEEVAVWVGAIRGGSEDIYRHKEVALRCFQGVVTECRQTTATVEKCLKKEAELAIAQLLAGENARQEVTNKF